MSTFESARFYVIDTPQTTLSDLARQLYGDAGSLLASDFQRLNATATDSAGQMRKGQLVFLPDPVCYRPDVEADIVHTITRVNILVREQMTLAERQLLARHRSCSTMLPAATVSRAACAWPTPRQRYVVGGGSAIPPAGRHHQETGNRLHRQLQSPRQINADFL